MAPAFQAQRPARDRDWDSGKQQAVDVRGDPRGQLTYVLSTRGLVTRLPTWRA